VDVARPGIEGLAQTAVGEDAAADPVPRFDKDEAFAQPLTFARGRKPRRAGTDDEHIRLARGLRVHHPRQREGSAGARKQGTACERGA
jgi:hypothetical protein